MMDDSTILDDTATMLDCKMRCHQNADVLALNRAQNEWLNTLLIIDCDRFKSGNAHSGTTPSISSFDGLPTRSDAASALGSGVR